MWFIKPADDASAEGPLRVAYDEDLNNDGYIGNTSRVWSLRPELLPMWRQVQKAVRSNMRLRNYELVTIAASHAIGCVYCMLAHGAVLRKNGFSAQQIIAILQDYHSAGLTLQEVHMMDYADKISRNPDSLSQADVDILRKDGLNDQQITDVALVAVVRNFMSRLFNSLGADPDPELIAKEPELWAYLKDWHE